MESLPTKPCVIRAPARPRMEIQPTAVPRLASGRSLLGSLTIHGGLIAAAVAFTWADSKPQGRENDLSSQGGLDFQMASPAIDAPPPSPSSPPAFPASTRVAVPDRTLALNLPPIERMFREPAPTESAPAASSAAGPKPASPPPSRRAAANTSGHKGAGNGALAGRKSPITPPKLIHAPPPHYPSQAKNIRQSGKTSVLIQVRPNGTAASASLYRSSGSSQLDQAAIEAARAWKFSKIPELDAGETFAVVVQVTFTL